MFPRLLAATCDHFAKAAPVIVGLAGDKLVSELPWTHFEVEDTGQLVAAVHEQMATAPVLVFPPSGNRRVLSQEGTRVSGDSLTEALLAELRPADQNSLLGVVLPASTLASERGRRIREAFAGAWQPAAVLYATGVFGSAHQSFQVGALILVPRHRGPAATVMFRAPLSGDAAAAEKDLQRLLRNGAGRGEHGYVIESALPPGESLQFERHDPAMLAREADLAGFGSTVRLDELFEIPAPGLHLVVDRALLCDAGADGAVRVVAGRDIGREGTVLPPDDDHMRWARLPADRQLRAGDVLVRRIFRASDHWALISAEVTAADLPAAASDTVIVLRPLEELSAEQRLFAILYLQSPIALALTYGSSLAGSAQVSRAGLRDLVVPVPDRALAIALEHVLAAKARLERWREDADALLRSVFQDDSSEAARARVIDSGRKLRLRVEAASLVDDFAQFVRVRYPYPIAYRWSRVQAATAAGDPGRAYEEILDAAEILLCYQALLGLALCREEHLNLGAVKGIRERLLAGRGPTFGDWTSILAEISKTRELRNLPKPHPLLDLRSLAASTEAAGARIRLKSRRNDKAHQRHIDPVDLPAAVSAALTDFTTLVEHAQILADWHLAYVETTRWDTFRQTADVSYRPMMGDHPVVPPRRTTHPDSNLEQGSLYLIDSDDRWHLLRPFLIGRDCPVCKAWSTFHVDRDNDNLVINSLEHGHTADGEWLAEALQHVSLL